MARILLCAWPFPGHLYPQIAIAHGLRRRGHEVAFCTGKRAARVLADEGFVHFPFEQVPEERIFDLLMSGEQSRWSWRTLTSFQHTLREWLLETVPQQMADLERAIAAWSPQAIGTDPTFWAPLLIVHEKFRLPVAVCSFVPVCMLPGPDVPPFGWGLPRPRNFRTRALTKAANAVNRVMSGPFRKEVAAIRSRYGLAPIVGTVTEHAGTMPLYLVPSAPAFDYDRKDLPPSVHYVGPCLWNSPRHEDPPLWLDDLPTNRPWVHVSEGTFHLGKPFLLKAAAEALADLPVEVIMTTGSDRDPASLGLSGLARNIHVVRWVSHAELLPRTAVVVTTGGAGSVMATIDAGVPLISVPTMWDKPDIAQHVAECGAGLNLAPRRCTPRRLRAAVERLLHEPSFRTSAQRLKSIFAGYGGAGEAARLLEQMVPLQTDVKEI
jgi:MGT family glycosyltransferase